jgi:hypothetical protein
MKDIKSDLRQRLEAIDKKVNFEQQRHDAALEKLERARSTIKAMIDLEENDGTDPQEDFFARKQTSAPQEVTAAVLESEIHALLKNQKDWAHSDIKSRLILKGLGTDSDPQFGRRVQGTLLSLLARGLVEKAGKRQWRALKKDSAAA